MTKGILEADRASDRGEFGERVGEVVEGGMVQSVRHNDDGEPVMGLDQNPVQEGSMPTGRRQLDERKRDRVEETMGLMYVHSDTRRMMC